MKRKKDKRGQENPRLAFQEVMGDRLRPPVAVVLGSPREVAELVFDLQSSDITCYQMDLYQAERLKEELAEAGQAAEVATAPDLWDLPAKFQTVLFPAAPKGERMLKLDMIEQAYHILTPRGILVVISPYEGDTFFPSSLKKIYGRVHFPEGGQGAILWCRREEDRPRRRHEMTYQARLDENTSLRFVSRPGVFSYGRFDDGARALVRTMRINPGDRVLDVGCGCGTNGTWAGKLSGPEGSTVFVDSNLRAVALADLNARANGLTAFETAASSTVAAGPAATFNVALANPPYYAQSTIAQLFIGHCRDLLKPGGRFYLVTRQPDQVGPLVAEAFGPTEVVQHHGYTILCAEASRRLSLV